MEKEEKAVFVGPMSGKTEVIAFKEAMKRLNLGGGFPGSRRVFIGGKAYRAYFRDSFGEDPRQAPTIARKGAGYAVPIVMNEAFVSSDADGEPLSGSDVEAIVARAEVCRLDDGSDQCVIMVDR